jgi:hypothetical protein
MALAVKYAAITIIEITSDGRVLIESLSVSKNEVILSGAWDFSVQEKESIRGVLAGSLLIPLGDEKRLREFLNDSQYTYLELQPFLKEAKIAAREVALSYDSYKADSPSKRKKLVAPEFYNWPDSVNLNDATEILESMGKLAIPLGTPKEMEKHIAAARLLRHLIEKWHLDEQERNNRKYIQGKEADITILPKAWLQTA